MSYENLFEAVTVETVEDAEWCIAIGICWQSWN